MMITVVTAKPKPCESIGLSIPIVPHSMERIIPVKYESKFVETVDPPIIKIKMTRMGKINWLLNPISDYSQKPLEQLRGGALSDFIFLLYVVMCDLINPVHGFIDAPLYRMFEREAPRIKEILRQRIELFMSTQESRFLANPSDRIFGENQYGRPGNLRIAINQLSQKMKHFKNFESFETYIDKEMLANAVADINLNITSNVRDKAENIFMNYLQFEIMDHPTTKWIKDGTFRLGDPRQRCRAVIGLRKAITGDRTLTIVFKMLEDEAVCISAYPVTQTAADLIIRTKNIQSKGFLNLSPMEQQVLRDKLYPNSTSAGPNLASVGGPAVGGPAKQNVLNFKNEKPPVQPLDNIPNVNAIPNDIPNPNGIRPMGPWYAKPFYPVPLDNIPGDAKPFFPGN